MECTWCTILSSRFGGKEKRFNYYLQGNSPGRGGEGEGSEKGGELLTFRSEVVVVVEVSIERRERRPGRGCCPEEERAETKERRKMEKRGGKRRRKRG